MVNLEEFFKANHIEEFGVASVDSLDSAVVLQAKSLFPDCRSIIIFAVSLAKEFFSLDKKIQMCCFEEFSQKVDKITFELSNSLTKAGFFSIPLTLYSPVRIEDAAIKGVLPLKYLALQTGLGSIGLNSVLISPKLGIRIMLSCVMTTKQYDQTPRFPHEICTRCGKCLKACPTKAICNGSVDLKKCMNIKAFFPAVLLPFLNWILGRKFLRKYLELGISVAAGHTEIACYKCITACPFFDR